MEIDNKPPASPPAAPPPPPAPADTSGTPAPASFDWDSWKSGLDDAAKSHIDNSGYTGFEDVLRSEMAGQQKLGMRADQLMRKPAESYAENPEAYQEILKVLGSPDPDTGYEAGTLDVEGVQFEDGMQDKVGGALAKAGLPPFMAKSVLENMAPVLKEIADAQAANAVDPETARKEAEDATRAEWGNAKFDAAKTAAHELLGQKGGDDLIAEIDKSGIGNQPAFLEFMAQVRADYGDSLIKGGLDAANNGRSGQSMSPAEAKAEIAKLEGDESFMKIYQDARHPDQKKKVEKMDSLYALAYPG